MVSFTIVNRVQFQTPHDITVNFIKVIEPGGQLTCISMTRILRNTVFTKVRVRSTSRLYGAPVAAHLYRSSESYVCGD